MDEYPKRGWTRISNVLKAEQHIETEVMFMTTNDTSNTPVDEGILPGNTRDERPVLYHLSHNGCFPITTVHRDELRQAGFDADNVDDDTMSELAEKMGDAYVENCFWDDLETLADDMDIPKIGKAKDNDEDESDEDDN